MAFQNSLAFSLMGPKNSACLRFEAVFLLDILSHFCLFLRHSCSAVMSKEKIIISPKRVANEPIDMDKHRCISIYIH